MPSWYHTRVIARGKLGGRRSGRRWLRGAHIETLPEKTGEQKPQHSPRKAWFRALLANLFVRTDSHSTTNGQPLAHTTHRNRIAAFVSRTIYVCILRSLCALLFAASGCGALTLDDLIDSDRDGLSDATERRLGVDPFNPDTDGDGLSDGNELNTGTSPLAFDSDGDGIPDGQDSNIGSPSRDGGSISTGNDVEPNDSFEAATGTNTGSLGATVFEGRIDQMGDVDVFSLGTLTRGDQITIDFIIEGSPLRPTVALFDADERVIDIRSYPFVETGLHAMGMVDQPVRRATQRHWLVVTHGANETTLGPYRLEVTIAPAESLPVPQRQTVLLDFRGGTFDPPILGTTTVDPFSAAAISEQYAGRDDRLKQGIVEAITEDFAGLDVMIITSDAPLPPGIETFTTILLGSTNDAVLAAARGVDPYNLDRCDDGVIFTAAFSRNTFGFTPELNRLALGIGQAASHEIGHLLGLRHVNDDAALMNEAPPSAALFLDLHFIEAPLGASTFPIGRQDAQTLLLETVGPNTP